MGSVCHVYDSGVSHSLTGWDGMEYVLRPSDANGGEVFGEPVVDSQFHTGQELSILLLGRKSISNNQGELGSRLRRAIPSIKGRGGVIGTRRLTL
ncbi:hypothetical protein JAAARDRAFT_29461 [Jaapia argillacea MUCL 33604]|uniref:Uncharacterized protein n=1 Tax=Jaapia argillacea MUCL 33604 TaxID=933084 RepID=A0A067Q913_9AGAM|nr:hypothetical protein JAAARDRAFT_29461 [Jaapia argillacea MUCL 33604]